MQFLVIAHDGEDSLEQRLARRDEHVARARKMQKAGNLLYAAALLDDQGAMNGSMMVFEFETRDELEMELAQDPYMLGRVWHEVTVNECRVGPMFGSTGA